MYAIMRWSKWLYSALTQPLTLYFVQDSLGSMTVDSEVIDEDLARESGHHNHKKLSSAGSTGGSTGRLGSSSSSRLRY